MNPVSFLLQGVALGLGAAISPGPFQSLVIRESLLGGLRRAAPVTFAPLLADIPVAIVLVFILGQAPPAFLDAVRLAGAGLLIYLAWDVWRQLRQAPAGPEAEASLEPSASTLRRGLMLGSLMLFLSPGTYLFWSLVNGPLLLQALDFSLLHAAGFLSGFYVSSISGLLFIAALVSRAGRISPAWQRGLRIFSILLLLGLAVWLLAAVFLV